MSWTVEPVTGGVFQLSFSDIKAGWEQYILLSSDRHHDNAHCNNALEKQHLDLALERNAPIIDIGDLFCAMQSRDDKRRSKKQLKQFLAENDNYTDLLLDEAEEFYAPYAHLFAMTGKGNHETAFTKISGTDLTYNIARRMRYAGGQQWPYAGRYAGYVVLKFDTGKYHRFNLKYFHGSGGGGPVTKGVIQAQRRSVIYPDADIVASGHIHESWIYPIKQERLSQRNKTSERIQWHVQCATYKDEFSGGEGWHVERGGPPKPLGCAWLKFSYDSSRAARINLKAELDII